MTPIEILQAIRDDRNVRFLDDTLDKAIDYLKMDTVHFKDIIKAIKELENLKVKIKEDEEKFKELLRENTALKITIDRLTIQEIDNNRIYHIEEKLKKAQSYIVNLENQIKDKSNGWMEK